MKVRFKAHPQMDAYASQFNIFGMGEVIAQGSWGADSVYVTDLDVYLEATGAWKDMAQAFRDKDIIPDNYNTFFVEPKTTEDRERGYLL